MSEEKRTFASVETFLRGMARSLPDDSSPPIFMECVAFSDAMEQNPLEGVNLPEPVLDFFYDMNSKLDTIIGLLSRDRLENDFPYPLEIVRLSGAKVSFYSKRPLKQGMYLEAVFILSLFPMRMAGAIGKVGEREKDKEGRDLWSLDITRIRERDLETMVHFVFQEERRHIREKKWD
jgi:hypothetical protein